jgi:hypothetical protein
MVEIVNLQAWRTRTRNELASGIVSHNHQLAADDETDRLIATLNKLMASTPMADEEKLFVMWTKLVEQLASIEDEARRKLYVERIIKLLNQDIVGSARNAFSRGR